MRTVIFDVDDTLYDQLIPFQRAAEKHLEVPHERMEEFYLTSRKIADALFHLSESGAMAMDDMQVYRIQRACEAFGITISREESLAFQKDYAAFQGQIELRDDMRAALDYCRQQQIQLGVITNGPTAHQWKKVQQLGLTEWIAPENIFVSAEVGIAKPSVEIFRHAEKKLALEQAQTLYVGDSYANDIVGAKDAGWQSVWLNYRQHQATENPPRYDHCLTTEPLTPLLKQIFS